MVVVLTTIWPMPPLAPCGVRRASAGSSISATKSRLGAEFRNVVPMAASKSQGGFHAKNVWIQLHRLWRGTCAKAEHAMPQVQRALRSKNSLACPTLGQGALEGASTIGSRGRARQRRLTWPSSTMRPTLLCFS
jgi:hypothetical protein